MSEKLSIGSTQIFRGGGQTLGESAVGGVCSTVIIYFAISSTILYPNRLQYVIGSLTMVCSKFVINSSLRLFPQNQIFDFLLIKDLLASALQLAST